MMKINWRLLGKSVFAFAIATYATIAVVSAALILPAAGFADFNFLIILIILTGSTVLFVHLLLTLPTFLFWQRSRLLISLFMAAASGSIGIFLSNSILEQTLVDDHDTGLVKNFIIVGAGIIIGVFSACLAWLIRRPDRDNMPDADQDPKR